MRRHYIDNLRWMILLILVPYHAAMAWNVWGEPNYINFEGNRAISAVVVFFSPFFMPLLFMLAGVSAKYALEKRTFGEFLLERAKRLLVPLVFGTVTLMPVMSYLADRFNCGYDGGFLEHYAVFFTRFTDLTGADGGFSVGQFWFLLYLFVVSAVCGGAVTLLKRRNAAEKPVPYWQVLLLGVPVLLLGDRLSVGGKNIAEYAFLFLVGYYIFSDDRAVRGAERYRLPLLAAGLVFSALDVYLFLWTDGTHSALNNAAKYASEWVMLAALVGMAKKHLDFTGRLSAYMRSRSFLFYFWHFVWVVASQYALRNLFGDNTAVLFFGTVLLSYAAAFVCCEICIRIPALCFLTGTKKPQGK